MQTQQALIEQQRATTAAVSAAGSSANKTVKHLDVLKAVRQPQSLKDRDGWEKLGFQVQTYLALLDSEYPVSLEAARKSVDPMIVADMTDDCADRGRKLFAMLNSWTQEMPIAVKIARGIRDQNGFEFWRLLHRELAPENHSKSLIWRRTLLSPKFPSKENEFSAALQEWEADLDKYESEYGTDKAISDEDKRAVVITEAPAALKQHLSMHLATLKTYLDVYVTSWCHTCKQSECGRQTPRMRVAPLEKTRMPWTLAKLGIRVVKVKRGRKERVTKAKVEKIATAKVKENHPRMMEERRMKKKDVQSVGRPAMPQTSAGTTPKVRRRARGNHKDRFPM